LWFDNKNISKKWLCFIKFSDSRYVITYDVSDGNDDADDCGDGGRE